MEKVMNKLVRDRIPEIKAKQKALKRGAFDQKIYLIKTSTKD